MLEASWAAVKKRNQLVLAVLTRPVGVVGCNFARTGKNCKNCHGIHHSCTPLRGAPDLRRPRGESPAPPPFCMDLSPCPNEVVHFISVCMHFCIAAYMHTSIYAYNANWGASTKNRSKNNRKSLRNRPQNGPKSVQNRSKIGPRSASEPTSLPTSILDRLGTVFGPFWARSWRPLGGLSGVKLGSSWSKNRFLEVLDGVQKRT